MAHFCHALRSLRLGYCHDYSRSTKNVGIGSKGSLAGRCMSRARSSRDASYHGAPGGRKMIRTRKILTTRTIEPLDGQSWDGIGHATDSMFSVDRKESG